MRGFMKRQNRENGMIPLSNVSGRNYVCIYIHVGLMQMISPKFSDSMLAVLVLLFVMLHSINMLLINNNISNVFLVASAVVASIWKQFPQDPEKHYCRSDRGLLFLAPAWCVCVQICIRHDYFQLSLGGIFCVDVRCFFLVSVDFLLCLCSLAFPDELMEIACKI